MNLKLNDKIALVACSNQLNISSKDKIKEIIKIFNFFNIEVLVSKNIFKTNIQYSSGEVRGKELNKFFKDDSIKYIFDISGGDLCNEILPYLDFNCIKNSKAIYFGYSDLSVLLNSIYKKTNKISYYYNLKNITNENAFKDFYNTFIVNDSNSLFNISNYTFIEGNSLNGIVIGGNIRCTLKLAGTEYFPDFNNSVLFLESYSGDLTKIRTFLAQYKLMNVFSNINGIILGQFTELSMKNQYNELINIMKKICNENNISLVVTDNIGHSNDSKGIAIGKYLDIKK
ncbi:LD-carboxypeptidase [Clostridium sp.]|uniref:LD-carboxypeptidase n=1 Tax=Clostridium sp. TaxID=1506 RepID=UPI0026DB09F4|nr:LD-carboxypeptidase [Clostridium sp.]MDO5038251.1 LD-carboxypeptidase [Clostridium sp.]